MATGLSHLTSFSNPIKIPERMGKERTEIRVPSIFARECSVIQIGVVSPTNKAVWDGMGLPMKDNRIGPHRIDLTFMKTCAPQIRFQIEELQAECWMVFVTTHPHTSTTNYVLGPVRGVLK